MLINAGGLDDVFTGFKTAFNTGLTGAESTYARITTAVPSTTREEHYGWLKPIPMIREWLGDRVVHNLTAGDYAIKNRKFELTLSVGRDDIEDDRYGLFGPLFEAMGRETGQHPDRLVYELLTAGFTTNCWDGKPFFADDHPIGDGQSVANMASGGGSAWFLIDGRQPLKPIVYQTRAKFDFTRLDRREDENVFMRDEYIYGVRGRSNVGFGLWQVAYASKATLDVDTYVAARAAMQSLSDDVGRPLGIRPTMMIVPPSLEADARQVLSATINPDGGSNIWAGTAELIVSPYLT